MMKKCNVLEGFGGRVTMTQKDPFGTLVFGKTINGVSQEGRLAQKPTSCVCVCVCVCFWEVQITLDTL